MSGPQRTEHPPPRAVHLGLGAFHRAHQAWYTQRANDARVPADGAVNGAVNDDGPWGIVAFTGRTPDAALRLSAQDGVYTLAERSADGDRTETVQSIVRAVPGSDDRAWLAAVADPEVSVLTVTVTETGYRPGSGPPERIARALAARRAAGAGPLAVVSCDNLLGNGRVLRDAVLARAGTDAGWIADAVSFVDTVVDRITPATTPADIDAVRALTGLDDPAAVVTEPFSEWVLAGAFPAGRPAWEAGGARFVPDVRPYEERKLWLLNAAHSYLAAAGRLAGCDTIAEAFAVPSLRAATEALWADHRAVIDLPPGEVDAWLDALRVRFDNPRIAHRLDQIRRDSTAKIPVRLLAPLTRRETAGLGAGDAQHAALDAWIASLLTLEPTDAADAALARELDALAPSERRNAVIARLTPEGTPA
ncbi:fructuronate reductase [Microbacterium resistens]|uniref:Mannitol-1-phosphate 5-dehydrogenase n=1 Tax=Microbacterium resistens TaxID=156977 RepID=A0ABU1SBY9_9MICO|nr:mannitol dehydrogenase family protein [Microbacterium resistens]MDR6867105.1 fructuronate reductase [Microbacterium resistens]